MVNQFFQKFIFNFYNFWLWEILFLVLSAAYAKNFDPMYILRFDFCSNGGGWKVCFYRKHNFYESCGRADKFVYLFLLWPIDSYKNVPSYMNLEVKTKSFSQCRDYINILRLTTYLWPEQEIYSIIHIFKVSKYWIVGHSGFLAISASLWPFIFEYSEKLKNI